MGCHWNELSRALNGLALQIGRRISNALGRPGDHPAPWIADKRIPETASLGSVGRLVCSPLPAGNEIGLELNGPRAAQNLPVVAAGL